MITSLTALTLKTRDQLEEYRRKQTELELVIAHMQATLQYLKSEGGGRDKVQHVSAAGLFTRGAAFGRCINILREHGPILSTSDLSRHLIKSKGLDPDDRSLHRAMAQTLISFFRRD